MDPEREPECERSGIKKNVVCGVCWSAMATVDRRANMPSVCDDAPPPSKHQKANYADEQRIKSIYFSNRRIRPKGPRESHQQARAERWRKYQEPVDA
jgi:hypothetical protein